MEELATTFVDTTPIKSLEKKTPNAASAKVMRRPLADVSNESPLSRACFNSELFLPAKPAPPPPCQLNTFILPSPATVELKSQPREDAASCDDSDEEEEEDDDDADASSAWSVSVNVSTPIDRSGSDDDDDEQEDEEEESGDGGEEDDEESPEEELCRGMGSISLAVANTYAGKHIRFCYDSDGDQEIKNVEVVREPKTPRLKLNGLPTPTGKHSRFEDPGTGSPVTKP